MILLRGLILSHLVQLVKGAEWSKPVRPYQLVVVALDGDTARFEQIPEVDVPALVHMGIDVEFRFGGHRGDATEAQSRFSKDEAGREVSSELVLQLVERDLAAAFGEAKRRRQAGDSATRDRHVWRVPCHAIPLPGPELSGHHRRRGRTSAARR